MEAAPAEKSKRSRTATSPAGSTTDSPTAPNKKSMNAWGKLLPSPSGTPCYLTQIKSLEERIRNTNVTLDNDKQTLLCLGMTLPDKFQYFTKIWFMTPEMTADKARNMLLEEEGRLNLDKNQDDHGLYIAAATRPAERRTPSKKAVENMDCTRCGKHHNEKSCWELHPEWLRIGYKRNGLLRRSLEKGREVRKSIPQNNKDKQAETLQTEAASLRGATVRIGQGSTTSQNQSQYQPLASRTGFG